MLTAQLETVQWNKVVTANCADALFICGVDLEDECCTLFLREWRPVCRTFVVFNPLVERERIRHHHIPHCGQLFFQHIVVLRQQCAMMPIILLLLRIQQMPEFGPLFEQLFPRETLLPPRLAQPTPPIAPSAQFSAFRHRIAGCGRGMVDHTKARPIQGVGKAFAAAATLNDRNQKMIEGWMLSRALSIGPSAKEIVPFESRAQESRKMK